MAEALDCSADISSSFVYVHTMTLPLPSQEGKEGSQSACNSPASSPQTTPKFPRRHSSWKHRKMPRSASTDVLVESPVSDSQYGRSTSHPAVTESGSMDNLAVAVKRHKSSREIRLKGFFGTMSRKHKKDPYFNLHYPRSVEVFHELLRHPSIDINTLNSSGDAPIHAIIKHKRSKRMELLSTLLIYSQVDVNLTGVNGNTPLHYAVMEGDENMVKLLLTFGACVNACNCFEQTPLDIAIDVPYQSLVELLVSVDGSTSEALQQKTFSCRLSKFLEFDDSLTLSSIGSSVEGVDSPDGLKVRQRTRSCHSFTLKDLQEGKAAQSLHDRLKANINHRLERSGSFSENDEATAIAIQQRELAKYRKTRQDHTVFEVKGGSRILSLDGGGMRGLIQIEVLRQLELHTGRKVTELFDWIVGTSTGGVIALAMVYGNKTLCELRQLYFKMKTSVFGSDRAGVAYDTVALEELLREELGESTRMGNIKFPRVLISAVSKKTTPPTLHFFNNCFDDEYSDELVWKVARYTSAAPMMFTSFEDYVDGGVLVNNPCESALTAIQNFHRQEGKVFDLAVVVSVGTGIFPPEELGKTDAQKFLFFGKHWFRSGHESVKQQAMNLITLLTTALVDSELVAENCHSRLLEQGIPFYRFSPRLEEVISAGESRTDRLVNMVIKTRLQTIGFTMNDLVQMLHIIAEMTRNLRVQRRCEASAAKLHRVTEV